MGEEKEHQRAGNRRLQGTLNGQKNEIKGQTGQKWRGNCRLGGKERRVDAERTSEKNIEREATEEEGRRLEEAKTNILAGDARADKMRLRLKGRGFGAVWVLVLVLAKLRTASCSSSSSHLPPAEEDAAPTCEIDTQRLWQTCRDETNRPFETGRRAAGDSDTLGSGREASPMKEY